MNLIKQWDSQYGALLMDAKGYDHKLVSKQLQALVGRNVQHFFSSTDEVLVRWNGKWCEFEEYNKVFKIL